MRKNLAKHTAKKLPLAKRVLALCFALIFVCSCLLPAFANGTGAELETPDTEVVEAAAPGTEPEPMDLYDEPAAVADEPAAMDDDFAVADEPEALDDDFAMDDEPAAMDDQVEKPVVDDEPAAMDDQVEKPVVDDEPAAMDNEVEKPVEGDEPPVADDTPAKEGAMKTTTDASGNTVYEYDTSGTTFPDDDAAALPEGDQVLDQMDAAFSIPTNIYHFWLKKMSSYDLEDIARDAETAKMTVEQYLAMYGTEKGCYHIMTAADGANLKDYQFANPTSNDDPEGNSRTFAGWYYTDELGDEQKFVFDECLYVSEGTTVEVYAKWTDEEKVEEPTTVDVTGNATVDYDSSVSIAVKVAGMPEDTKSLSVAVMDDDAMESFYEVYSASLNDESEAMMPLVGFNITPKDDVGVKVQPTTAVTVTISDLTELGLEDDEKLKVLHQTASGVETLDAEYNNGTLSFKTESFSNFVIATKEAVQTYADYNNITVTINDTVTTNGLLTLDVVADGESVTAQELLDNGYSITWKNGKSTVTRTKVAGDHWNLAEDGSWLNVGYDMALTKTVDVKGEKYSVAITKDSNETYKSASITIQEHSKLQDGSFEDYSIDSSFQPYVNGGIDVVWKTTATDNKIELISVDPNKYDGNRTHRWMSQYWHGMSAAAAGMQYAELNANYESSLYQDVLTTPGASMNWQVAHTARLRSGDTWWWGQDTMYVVIMAADQAAELAKSQEQLKQVAADLFNSSGSSSQYPGARAYKFSSNQHKWEARSGEYVVPEGQYYTRFFFVSASSASGYDLSVGNQIDNVWFSTETPPPSAGSARITVEKRVTGLTLDEVKNNLSDKEFITNDGADEIKFAKDDWKQEGEYIVARKIIDLSVPANESIDETFTEDKALAAVDGYTMTLEEDETQTITVREFDNKTVTFTNDYTKNASPVVISKIVKGLFGDHEKSFNFVVTVNNGDEHEFNLKHGQSSDAVIEAKVRDTLIITENDVAGYTVSAVIRGKSGNELTYKMDVADKEAATKTITIEVTEDMITDSGIHIEVINERDATIDNGVLLDTLPYILILVVVVGGGVLLFLRKRKNDDDE